MRRLAYIAAAMLVALVALAAQAAYVDFCWDAPTTNEDGTAIQPGDLIRYRIVRKTLTASTWTTSAYPHLSHTNYLVVQTEGTVYIYGIYSIGRGGKQSATMSNVVTVNVPKVVSPTLNGATVQEE
jgi:hypothetical protein